jgi:hypothetical protein
MINKKNEKKKHGNDIHPWLNGVYQIYLTITEQNPNLTRQQIQSNDRIHPYTELAFNNTRIK